MDNNHDNINYQRNPINTQLLSPLKDSPYKNNQHIKDYKYYSQSSPFHSNIEFNFTPSKKINFMNGYCQSLGETPIALNMNLPFSPLSNNQGGDASYQRSLYQRGQNFNSPFKPLITTPQNISYKK